MPDDIIEEVAEQPPENAEVDEAVAFEEIESKDTGLEKKPAKEPVEPEEPVEKKEEKEDEPEEPEEPDDEEDEDVKRGKEILEAKRAEEAEKQKAEQEAKEKQQKAAADPRNILEETWTGDDVQNIFAANIPKNLFPKDPVELADGTVLDFQNVIKEYPELPTMVMMIANNMVRQMVQNGAIVGSESYKADKENFSKTITEREFIRTVTHKKYGVPEAINIVKADGFKDWFAKQTDEIKALRTSGDPWDFISLLNRYKNKEIIGEAKKQVEEKDAARAEKKKLVDGVLKSDKRKTSSNKPKTGELGLGSKEDEKEEFAKDDDDII